MSAQLPTEPRVLDEPRTLTHVLYALHTITFFSGGIFSVIAIIINLVKSPDLPNAFYRSHWRWRRAWPATWASPAASGSA